ncbi:hypothetical protein [Rothia sp. HMSC069C01]|nr:hypothetical protein [Rothia sp. HMSC069C01]
MSPMRSHITSLGYRNWCFGSVHSLEAVPVHPIAAFRVPQECAEGD